MKIAIWHNLPSGGGKRAFYHHVEGLVKRGHVVESWSPPITGQWHLPVDKQIDEHVLPFAPETPRIAAPLSYLLFEYRVMANKIEAMDRHCELAAAEIDAGHFDLLLAYPCTVFRVTAIGRYVQIPKVLYLHEPYRDLYEAAPRLPWLAMPRYEGRTWTLRGLRRFLHDLVRVQALRLQAREEYQNAAAFDELLVNSQYSRESVLRAYGLDSRVCYLGVSTEIFRPLGLPRERCVIGLGAIHPSKGVDVAIQAVATIRKDKRPTLVWVGNFADPGYERHVRALAETLEVTFVPRVAISDEELVELLNRATSLIYTSRLEPFGLAPLEANACGTPVVAVAEGGVRETIDNGVNGVLVPDRRPDAIGRALLELLESPGLVKHLGERARANVVERWKWEDAIDRLETSLFEVAGKHPA